MKSNTKIFVSENALKTNVGAISGLLHGKASIIAVVKADAYSHGALQVVKILKKQGIKYFAVSSSCEARSIIPYVYGSETIVLSFPYDIEFCLRNKVIFTVSSLEELKQAIDEANKLSLQAYIHIKINTGMNRLGFSNKTDFELAMKLISQNPSIYFHGIFTHFCTARANISFAQKQAKLFENYLLLVPPIFDPIIHIGGHETIDFFDKTFFNSLCKKVGYVRVGLALFGYGRKGLKRVLKIESKIIQIQDCKKDDNVGYGGKCILQKDTTIAVIPFGYADGMPRALGNGNAVVKVKGKKCPTIGNICMDWFMIDISQVNDVKVGDKVTIFSNASDWAKVLGTIEYEVLTNIKSSRCDVVVK